MTRKEKKKRRKAKQTYFVSKEKLHNQTLKLLKLLMSLPKKHKHCNQTFITEQGEHGCFPFGGYYKDINLCKYCYAKEYCQKEKTKHKIKLKEWRCCNEKYN